MVALGEEEKKGKGKWEGEGGKGKVGKWGSKMRRENKVKNEKRNIVAINLPTSIVGHY